MNSDQNNRTNRDQEPVADSSQGRPGTERAAGSPRPEHENAGSMASSPERSDNESTDSRRAGTDSQRNGDPLGANNESERSPSQENL